MKVKVNPTQRPQLKNGEQGPSLSWGTSFWEPSPLLYSIVNISAHESSSWQHGYEDRKIVNKDKMTASIFILQK
ncbi:MAG: hypothetical protein WBB24_13720 [Maribacter sp.]